jgi:hypothetical protein
MGMLFKAKRSLNKHPDVCTVVTAVNFSLGKLHRALGHYVFFSGRSFSSQQ